MRFPLWQIVLFCLAVIVLSIRLFPSSREIGLFYYKSKKYDQVESYLAKQFHDDPTDLANAFRYLTALNETGKYELLEEEGKKMLAVYPEDYNVHQFMAKFYEDRLMTTKASRHWLKMLELNPKEETLPKKLVYYYRLTKNYPALIELYEKELAQHPDDSQLYYDLAGFYAMDRNLNKTKETYELLVKNFPEDIDAKRVLAQILEIVGRSQEALSLYREITQKDPKNQYGFEELLEKLLFYKEEREALEFTQGLMERFSDPQPFLLVISGFFTRLQNQQEWMTILEKFHGQRAQEPIVMRLLGEVYYEKKNYSAALELLQELHDTNQCDYYSHYLMANIYEAWEKSSEANFEYELALRHLERYDRQYSSVEDKLIKAQILKKLGRTKDSLLVVNLVLLREPNNPFALELSAGNYIDLRRMPLARERLEKLYSVKDSDSNLLKVLSEIYIKMGDYNKAESTLRSYHEKTGGDYRSYHMYGNVLANMGDHSGSQRAYSEALRLIQSTGQ